MTKCLRYIYQIHKFFFIFFSIMVYYRMCVCVCVCELLSCVWLFATPWTVAHQAPLSMGFSRQEYWRGLPVPPPGALPHPGIEPKPPTLQAASLPSEPPGKPYIEYISSSLCYTGGPCYLAILYAIVCICPSQTPTPSFSHSCSLASTGLFSMYQFICVVL